jgi:NADPH:quinone reductase-like Zn-dependent oxidoreductase
MKAEMIYRYGGPDELKYGEMPMPTLNHDDVLIKVLATSVNPVDYKVREGHDKWGHRKFPVILGWDVSGVIERVGRDVKNFNVGDEVYARPDVSRNGTYAEYVAVRVGEIALKPRKLDHLQSAVIPLAGLTAYQGLFTHGKLQEGQRVFINGASGGVGTFAVQLARWKGAYVIGTASGDNVDFVKEQGADEVIDYKKENIVNKLNDIDLVFDLIGGDQQRQLINVLKPGGILVCTVGITDAPSAKAAGIKTASYTAQSEPADLKMLAKLADEGSIKPVISSVFLLSDVAKAHQLSIEGHVRGKIGIQI